MKRDRGPVVALCATMLALAFLGCAHAKVRPEPLHPVALNHTRIDGLLKHKQPVETIVRINGVEARRCEGENPCSVALDPQPGAANQTIDLEVTTTATDGKVYGDRAVWPLIGCTGEYTFASPTQIPSSTLTQTGPNLYQLSDPRVWAAAQEALLEYANSRGISLEEIDTGDELVEAVADYVDGHMTWRSDNDHNPHCINTVHGLGYQPGWDFPIPANYTVRHTGAPACNCPTDYCGDCEDHGILRAALLRALGFRSDCIWNVIDNPVTHEYNVVVYEGAFRLMDYGPISSTANVQVPGSLHRSYFGYNEEFGPRGATDVNHGYLASNAFNYKLHQDLQPDPKLKEELRCKSSLRWTYVKRKCP